MPNNKIDLRELVSTGTDILTIVISRVEILEGDIKPTLGVLQQLISDPTIAKHFRERVDISFDGFDNTPEELWEIIEVRDFVNDLDEAFPYWLYFLSKKGFGLYFILKCFLLPHIKPEAQNQINGPRLQEYLLNRGFKAMNYICELTGITEDENAQMTSRFVAYWQNPAQ